MKKAISMLFNRIRRILGFEPVTVDGITHRYVIHFPEDIDDLMQRLAEGEGVDKSEIIKRAIIYYGYLSREVAEGWELILVDEDGEIVKKIVFPIPTNCR